jgi:hypothetical protein
MKMFKAVHVVDSDFCGQFVLKYMEERIITEGKILKIMFPCLLTQKSLENRIHQHSLTKKIAMEKGELCCPRIGQVILLKKKLAKT